MFDCLQNDDTPILILNGGHTIFQTQMDEFGPLELINGLKDTKFLQQYGKIYVS